MVAMEGMEGREVIPRQPWPRELATGEMFEVMVEF